MTDTSINQDKYKVYLVNAGNDVGHAAIANDHCFPALGILELGTWLKHQMPDIDIICRDGGVMTTEEINKEIEEIKPNLVGVSVLSTSYQNSLAIAAVAKNVGSKVVFGNDHAAELSKEILGNQQNVDFVVGAEYGEEPLEQLIQNLREGEPDLSDIPHLTYRDSLGTICGPHKRDRREISIVNAFPKARGGQKADRKSGLDILPLMNWKLYPESHWKTYNENYRKQFGHLHGKNPVTGVTTINRARGCSRAADPCTYCDLALDIAFSSPKIFWDEIRNAHKEMGANVFYEVCDSFSSFPDLIRGIAENRPPDLGFEPQFFVYCQALDIVRNPDLPRKLKEMGVFRVNIGLDSGCDITLKDMKGKYDSVAVNYEALTLLKEQGIHVYGSFVLGTDKETPETMSATIQFIRKIIKEGLISDVEAQPIFPLPDNVYGKKLIAERGDATNPFRDIARTDWPFDLDAISKHYIDKYSGVTYEQTIAAVNEIREMAAAARINYGTGFVQRMLYGNPTRENVQGIS